MRPSKEQSVCPRASSPPLRRRLSSIASSRATWQGGICGPLGRRVGDHCAITKEAWCGVLLRFRGGLGAGLPNEARRRNCPAATLPQASTIPSPRRPAFLPADRPSIGVTVALFSPLISKPPSASAQLGAATRALLLFDPVLGALLGL
ncbi:hypothetical protein VTN96DRAFT_6787 [Rasamsonia emersonii]